jgi:hypothetical protein
MVYLVVLSGVLAILRLPFALPDVNSTNDVQNAQAAYRITATMCSLFSMIEGSRPFILSAVAGRLQALLSPKSSTTTKSDCEHRGED